MTRLLRTYIANEKGAVQNTLTIQRQNWNAFLGDDQKFLLLLNISMGESSHYNDGDEHKP